MSSIDFVDFDVLPPDRIASLRERTPFTVGAPRDREHVTATLELAVAELREHGYPYATVSTSESSGASGREAEVVFTAVPGVLAHFGAVEIVGQQSVGEAGHQTKARLQCGELYRRSVVQDSQRTLYGLELFQFVNIEIVDPEKQEPEVRTRVTVVEGRHQRVNFGVGYGTEDKARVQGDYRHVNFLGGARTAGVQGRWSSLDRGLRASFNQPYVFAPHFSAGLEGQLWRTVTPAYESRVAGGRTTLDPSGQSPLVVGRVVRQRVHQQLYLRVGAERPDARGRPDRARPRSDDRPPGRDAQRRSRSTSTTRRPTTCWTRAGATRWASTREAAGSLLPGTFNFTAVSFDARHFLPLGERLVVATRLQVGQHQPEGRRPGQRAVLEEVPPRRLDEHPRVGPLRGESARR